MRLALIGFGNVGRAFARLLDQKRQSYPFRITAIHTANHGTAYADHGIAPDPEFGPAAPSVESFLDRAQAEVVVELTTLAPMTGEPARTHISRAFERGAHVVTANKGPIAHAYADLCAEARQHGVEFRFESTCMDGAPVFNMVRNTLPGVKIFGFTGVLNSTSNVVIEAMRRGLSLEEGIAEAQRLGIAESDPNYDLDGWDSAAKTAALANVLMDARTDPTRVERHGLNGWTPERLRQLAADGKNLALVSRAETTEEGLSLRVRPEVLEQTDLLACIRGTSNLFLLHTDLMGTVGTVSISPGVEQTAYGIFSDIVDIARTI